MERLNVKTLVVGDVFTDSMLIDEGFLGYLYVVTENANPATRTVWIASYEIGVKRWSYEYSVPFTVFEESVRQLTLLGNCALTSEELKQFKAEVHRSNRIRS